MAARVCIPVLLCKSGYGPASVLQSCLGNWHHAGHLFESITSERCLCVTRGVPLVATTQLQGSPPQHGIFYCIQGLLLAGFSEEHSKKAIDWMREMEPDFKVSHVVDDMVTEPLGDALYNPDSQVWPIILWAPAHTVSCSAYLSHPVTVSFSNDRVSKAVQAHLTTAACANVAQRLFTN
jgi:hypothetical protein